MSVDAVSMDGAMTSSFAFQFAISTQKHVDLVLGKLSKSATAVDLVFCRNTREDGRAYDLAGLAAFPALTGLVIAPEDAWTDPIRVQMPRSVLARLLWFRSDWICLQIVPDVDVACRGATPTTKTTPPSSSASLRPDKPRRNAHGHATAQEPCSVACGAGGNGSDGSNPHAGHMGRHSVLIEMSDDDLMLDDDTCNPRTAARTGPACDAAIRDVHGKIGCRARYGDRGAPADVNAYDHAPYDTDDACDPFAMSPD